MLVEIHGDDTTDKVLAAVVELGLALIRIEPRRSSLEDLFRDTHRADDSDDDMAA